MLTSFRVERNKQINQEAIFFSTCLAALAMPCVLACVCDVMWVRACLVFFYSRSGDNFLRSASGGLRNFFLKFVEICWRFLRQRLRRG